MLSPRVLCASVLRGSWPYYGKIGKTSGLSCDTALELCNLNNVI